MFSLTLKLVVSFKCDFEHKFVKTQEVQASIQTHNSLLQKTQVKQLALGFWLNYK